MALNIKYDVAGNPEVPTLLLATRNGTILGQLKVEEESVDFENNFNNASELSFTMYKYIDGELNHLWDKTVDFKLVKYKELDMWFEIKVELNDSDDDVTKIVYGKQLGQAELSQIILNNIEINTEKDIERDDYKVTTLYNEEDTEASLLHRLLKDKAPHYTITYVDPIIAKIQRTFSFNGKSIYDVFQEIATEIGCLFVFPSNSDGNGKIQRTIEVYDLQQNCLNPECKHRGEFTDVCPKCGGKDKDEAEYGIQYGYGENTLIFVTSDELATKGIKLTTDVDAVKNCFRLEAGDDLMTATIRNCNPNGTQYIWRFSKAMKEDMSEDLVNKIESYDQVYKEYYNDYVSNINKDLLDEYNNIIDKYKDGNKDLIKIETPIKGYSALMDAYYNTIDLALYLKSGLMPSVDMDDTTAQQEYELLKNYFYDYKNNVAKNYVAVADITKASDATIRSAILSVAKTIVRSTYKVEIKDSYTYEESNHKFWEGVVTITSYSDEEDTYSGDNENTILVEVNDDLEVFTKQKIDKLLKGENKENLSVTGLFEREYEDFCAQLKKYSFNPLVAFRDCCQACIDILIGQNITGSENTNEEDNQEDVNGSWGTDIEGDQANLYENLYLPFYNKLIAIETEIKERETEIAVVVGKYDLNGELITKGLQDYIIKCRNEIQKNLNFEDYLGNDLWLEFCSYRREDAYSNDNFISEGLNNAEMFKRALEFFELAQNEIYKSSEKQHSISTTLNNLLAIPKFENLLSKFELGNWIRVKVDDVIYKLRLISYGVDYGSLDTISVEFSDVTKIKNGITDIQNVLSQASSMATSYTSIQRQMSQSEKTNDILNDWIDNGLNITNAKIINANNQNQVWNKNGILCRSYDEIEEKYSDEQLKIINNTIAITDDNWKTTKTAIGKIHYKNPDGEIMETYGINAETVIGKLLLGQQLQLTNNNNNMSFDENGLLVKNDINTVSINPNDNTSLIRVVNNGQNIFSLNKSGGLVITGEIHASSFELMEAADGKTEVKGLSDVALSGKYEDLVEKPNLDNYVTNDKLSDYVNKSELEGYVTGDELSASVVEELEKEKENYKIEIYNSIIEELRNQGIIS